MIKKILITALLGILILNPHVFAQTAKEIETLSLDEFIELACARDKVFDRILIENLKLNYKKKLELPADDIVISAKSEYEVFLKYDKGYPVYEVTLSKLFPYTGTEIEVGYNSTIKDTIIGDVDAEFYASVSQPVARNAFGKATRLLDKIVGMEIDIAKYQIVEAYEQYLSIVISIYYDWYEAYENVKTAENSYNANVKLLENVEERAKNNIALPVDVNKVKLQVLLKEETLIALRSQFEEYTNLLKKSIGYDVEEALLPYPIDQYDNVVIDFEKDYKKFREDSRTSMILDMLEEKSALAVDKDADDLLPSIDLFAEYAIKSDDRYLRKDDKRVFAGVSLDYPFPGQVEHAEQETAKVEHERRVLEKVNTHIRIYTELRNIYEEIKKTRELIKISEKKVEVAQSIVKDDTVNYSYGKVILNNFIDEVNQLDFNRFSKIQYNIKLKKLIVDWLTLTDQLVRKKGLDI
ncbi:MAG: TolC family protein [Candidatus Omnitrophica bacterium]|nr:TolC family protein [Candidatus Omnitrophota bacterium]MBU1128275.1 TolC family protein [Candidatus Omnitrophota bacterium]MBU1657208.1 TolC family protein [Candidatus Omnitrophota bacterium]MBU1784031.1 TolC family protein [Candidatus Omnitrophota bacterium]MBU1851025.1 TolC family protein [Candidatus Omnitrophota bacterium]